MLKARPADDLVQSGDVIQGESDVAQWRPVVAHGFENRSRTYDVIVAGRQRDDEGDVFEIGRELADAVEAEARHRAAHPDARLSPLSGAAYDLWAGDHDLVRFSPSPVDRVVRAVVTEFRNAPLEQRSTLRDRLTMDDCYTLISYARRTAVLAARESDTAAAGDAAVALAMIDADRVDWRDVLVALGLVGHVLVGLGDTGALGAARDMATGDIVSMIARFALPSREDAEAAT